MTACILSQQNLRDIKAILRSDQCSIGSAHATEAVARAFGYNTNAALIAAMNEHPCGVSMVGRFDRRACQNSLCDLTSDNSIELNCLDEQEIAKFAAWRRIPSRDDLSRTFNEWHTDCAELGVPCVSIIERVKLARVKWDLTTIPYEIEMEMRQQDGDQIVELLYDTFSGISTSQGPHPKAIFEGSTYYGYIDNLPIETAVEVANQLCLLFNQEILERCRLAASQSDYPTDAAARPRKGQQHSEKRSLRRK